MEILQLPNEILLYIGNFLDSYESWPLAATCRRMYEILLQIREKRRQCRWLTCSTPFFRTLAGYKYARAYGYLLNEKTSIIMGEVSPPEVIRAAIADGMPVGPKSCMCARDAENLALLMPPNFQPTVFDAIIRVDPDRFLRDFAHCFCYSGWSLFIDMYPHRIDELFKTNAQIENFYYKARKTMSRATYDRLRELGVARNNLVEAIQANAFLDQIMPTDRPLPVIGLFGQVETHRYFVEHDMYGEYDIPTWLDLRVETLPAFRECLENDLMQVDSYDYVEIDINSPILFEGYELAKEYNFTTILRQPQSICWTPNKRTARFLYAIYSADKVIHTYSEANDIIMDALLVLSEGSVTDDIRAFLLKEDVEDSVLVRVAWGGYMDIFIEGVKLRHISAENAAMLAIRGRCAPLIYHFLDMTLRPRCNVSEIIDTALRAANLEIVKYLMVDHNCYVYKLFGAFMDFSYVDIVRFLKSIGYREKSDHQRKEFDAGGYWSFFDQRLELVPQNKPKAKVS